MRKNTISILLVPLIFTLSLLSCGTNRKLVKLKRVNMNALLMPSERKESSITNANGVSKTGKGTKLDLGLDMNVEADSIPPRDTLKIKGDDGKEYLIMRASKDENGEMVAQDVIKAAMVTAKFKNAAERNGKVDIAFQIIVPKEMQDRQWQLRFYPKLYIHQDSIKLEPLLITGQEYRNSQLKGYQQYERFLSTIVKDRAEFINFHQLEIFLQRNIPEIYKYKNDSSFVSDKEFTSIYGISQQKAVEHYTNKFLLKKNQNRIAMKGKMYDKYVKMPIISEGIRLDTVIKSANGDIIYNYEQSIRTRPKLKKVDVLLNGDIYHLDKKIYEIPKSDSICFYISSLSSFIEYREKYMTKIIERKAEANIECCIEFKKNLSDVDIALGENKKEINKIQKNLSSLIENKVFDLDSIVVTASCSPEGEFNYNEKLSKRRAHSVSDFFKSFIKNYTDSLRNELGIVYKLDKKYSGEHSWKKDIPFSSRNNGENWERLDELVKKDSSLSIEQKNIYNTICREDNADKREYELSKQGFYNYLTEALYPKLRIVKFKFHLHRKGMIKDTIHTTVLDTTYMNGLEAIKDRDYKKAITLLRPYNDYNTALAYCAMDCNASALSILQNLKASDIKDKVEYLLAIIYSRMGKDEESVQHYLNSCKLNPSYVHRGNLDPEIYSLIKRYDLKF